MRGSKKEKKSIVTTPNPTQRNCDMTKEGAILLSMRRLENRSVPDGIRRRKDTALVSHYKNLRPFEGETGKHGMHDSKLTSLSGN